MVLTPFTLYGPFDVHGPQLRQAADHVDFLAVAQRGLPHILRAANGRSLHVKPTSCGPAVTLTRPVMRASMSAFASFMSLACDFVVLRAADLRGIHLCAVDRDHERVRRVVALDAGVAFLDAPDQPARTACTRRRPETHGGPRVPPRVPSGRPVDVSVLAELAADRILAWSRLRTPDRRRPSR